MHSSFIAIFVAVLAPVAILASPHWHPQGPPSNPNKWHHGPPGPESSATASISVGNLPPGGFLPTSVSGYGSTGTPKLAEKKKVGVSGVARAGSTGTPKLAEKKEGVSGVAGAGSTGTPKKAAVSQGLAAAPAASATVSLTSYD